MFKNIAAERPYKEINMINKVFIMLGRRVIKRMKKTKSNMTEFFTKIKKKFMSLFDKFD